MISFCFEFINKNFEIIFLNFRTEIVVHKYYNEIFGTIIFFA